MYSVQCILDIHLLCLMKFDKSILWIRKGEISITGGKIAFLLFRLKFNDRSYAMYILIITKVILENTKGEKL